MSNKGLDGVLLVVWLVVWWLLTSYNHRTEIILITSIILNSVFFSCSPCVSECPTGSNVDIVSAECLLCNHPCELCLDSFMSVCQTCVAGYFMLHEEGKCVQACPIGTYYGKEKHNLAHIISFFHTRTVYYTYL